MVKPRVTLARPPAFVVITATVAVLNVVGLVMILSASSGREFICNGQLTLADIMLFAFLDFGAGVGQPIDPALKAVTAHHAMMKARPSAAA